MKTMLECVIQKELRDFMLNVSISCRAGEMVVLKGENGAGKTTILRIIAGLIEADSGAVHLNGVSLYDHSSGIFLPPEERRLAYLHQRTTTFPHMTVRDNIAYGLVSQGKPGAEIKEQVTAWMKHLSISDLAGVKGRHLSGGQQQRVALARALAIQPSLLLLDEPFTALDVQTRDLVRNCVKQYVKNHQIPCLLVSHHHADVEEIADRYYEIERGSII